MKPSSPGKRAPIAPDLESYHTTGFLIDAHILFFKARAGYGEKVIPQLARAINANDRVLYRCLRFFREYPILTRGSELGWSHYRVLLDVPDKTQRKTLELSARKNDWTAPELERRVRALNAIDVTPAAPLTGAASTRAKLLTPEGKAAKRFTESLVNSAQSVTISTTKPDKYDRYLADVFIRTSTGDAPFKASAKEGEIFLNNALLEAGHAVTKKAWEFGDWEKS